MSAPDSPRPWWLYPVKVASCAFLAVWALVIYGGAVWMGMAACAYAFGGEVDLRYTLAGAFCLFVFSQAWRSFSKEVEGKVG